MKHVAIDCRLAESPTGLGRYTRSLVSHLLQRDDPIRYTLLISSTDKAQWLPKPTHDSPVRTGTGGRLTNHSLPYSLYEQIEIPRILRSLSPDLFFCPHFNVPLLCRTPFIATIHDLILHHYPNTTNPVKRMAYRILMRHTVYRAQKLITVSQFTADDLARTYGSRIRQKLHVIHNGVGEQFSPRSKTIQNGVLEKYRINTPFFLYVGNAKEHKNVQMLIDAFVLAHIPNTTLLLVTGGKEAQRLHLKANIRLLPNVGDADLAALYSAATAFVTASLYEGFCLPAAEAIACGCPVIASKCGPLAAVTKKKALLIEPTTEAFVAALQNPPPSPQPSRPFLWKETAEQVVEQILVPLV